jgi:hypothetical protein
VSGLNLRCFRLSGQGTPSLNVNAVEPECILVDDAVNSVIAAAAKCAASIGDGTAKAHTQKQIDDKALKKIRRRTADAIEQFARAVSICRCAARIISSGVSFWFTIVGAADSCSAATS